MTLVHKKLHLIKYEINWDGNYKLEGIKNKNGNYSDRVVPIPFFRYRSF